MTQTIQILLNSAGVFSHYCGYRYFIRAVELAVQNPACLQYIQKGIYLIIASEYGTTAANVERDIRTIRDVMMKNGGHQLLVQLTGSPVWADKTPYPKTLISIFCAYLTQKRHEAAAV